MNYSDLKRWIFKLDPETAHEITEKILHLSGEIPLILKFLEKNFSIKDERLSQNLFNTTFPNPVGLAAGFDKNATMIKATKALGFGFSEVGTVTPYPQSGNPKPRLFRYPDYESIQNAMGFNNDGAKIIKKRVQKLYPFKIQIGVNLGKNKTTLEDDAIEDYKFLIKEFKDYCDFLVINISSPNTPNLRDLQNEIFIKELFKEAKNLTSKPILLKLAPDMDIDKALLLCQTAIENEAGGIIATNTTMDYSLIKEAKNFGGLSGKVLREKSFLMFKEIAKAFFKKTILISVGGIDSAKEAYERIKEGASLVEVLSALIFKGPSLAKNINQEILELMQRDGFKNIKEAIGANR